MRPPEKTNGPDAPPADDATGGVTFSRRALVALTLVFALYVAARVWRLDASCLWFDEIFGVHAARHTWVGMLRFIAADLIHPPLFYALLKIWIAAGGESLAWLRLFPALTSIAAVAPFLLLARELRLRAAEVNLALLLLAINGYLIKYAQEVRMYSLLLFFALSSLWLFISFIRAEVKTKRTLLALFFVNLLLIYTHYYGWLVVLAEAFFLLVKNRAQLPQFLYGVAALCVCFAPWAYACFDAAGAGGGLAQNIGWQTRPGLTDVWELVALFQQPFYFRQSSAAPPFVRWGAPLGLLLITAPVVSLLVRVWQRAKTGDAERPAAPILLLVFALVPVAFAFTLSYVLPVSVWGTRHLIVAAAPYLLLGAVALVSLRPRWLRDTALVVLGCWITVAALASVLRRESQLVWCKWGDLAAEVMREETAGEPVAVYAFEDLNAYHLWFAFSSAQDERFKVTVVKGVAGLTEDPAYFLPRRFDGVNIRDASALAGERLWLAFRDTSFNEDRPPLKLLKERGYRVEKIFETSAQGQRAFLVLVSR